MLVTIGHGTLDAGQFVRLLADASVAEPVDVRSYPGSRRVPHFGREAIAAWVPAAGVRYRWEPALGGRRRLVGHMSAHEPSHEARVAEIEGDAIVIYDLGADRRLFTDGGG